jgi:hypothetical protein
MQLASRQAPAGCSPQLPHQARGATRIRPARDPMKWVNEPLHALLEKKVSEII